MKINFDNLQSYTMGELRMIAKMFRIKKPTSMNKKQLIGEIEKMRESGEELVLKDNVSSSLATDLIGDINAVSQLKLSDRMEEIKEILTDCIVCVLSANTDVASKKQILTNLLKALDKTNEEKNESAYIKSVKNFVNTL
ncbi:MAG: Rho termination factor N-terminal domain-containing protein [Clostridia bacterium]|nr:Rho termination factor N-terminal domain-containing protein [Clostridia bacterium]